MRNSIKLTAALVLAAATFAAPAFANGPQGDHGNHRGGYAQNDRGRDAGRAERGNQRNDWNRGGNDRRQAYSAPQRYYGASQPYRGPQVQRLDYRPMYRTAPPRLVYQGRPGWARGHYVSHYNRPVYVVNDYDGYGLRRPPRGYHWVRDDYGDYLLVAVATGLIADLIFNR